MKHYGDITKINGSIVEPINVVIGGSSCQDLSVAGKQAGLADCESRGKHFGKSHYRAILDMAAEDRAVLPRDGPLATLMQEKERSAQK